MLNNEKLTLTGAGMKRRIINCMIMLNLTIMCLSGCFSPPYNNFNIHNRSAAFIASRSTKQAIIKRLQKQDIQFIQHGDTMTLIVPTDRYYVFDTPKLNDICYPGLVNIIRLLRHYPSSTIYVASFTDDIGGARYKQKLSQARAEAMLTFLWANDINAKRLQAEGYGDKHDIAQNAIIHGSAQNRRVEIQWFNAPVQRVQPPVYK